MTFARDLCDLCREQYRNEAQMVYQEQLLSATRGRGRFPQVRTFKAGLGSSTNSVYQDMEQAQSWWVWSCGRVGVAMNLVVE